MATAVSLAACASPVPNADRAASHYLSAIPWPEADALFHREPHWLGADGAWSVDLGGNRVLWLFADTFVDPGANPSRSSATATMVSNSVAIQTGRDPSDAAIEFFWRTTATGEPDAFFPDADDARFWPGDGVRLGDRLFIFLMHVRAAEGGLGFEVFDWSAVAIENPDDSPDAWRVTALTSPERPAGLIVGSSGVLVEGDYVYVFASREPGTGEICLARWNANDFAQGVLSALQWWTGGGWEESATEESILPVFEHFGTECTIHRDALTGRFLNVHTVGFGCAKLSIRSASALNGPWSDDVPTYSPPECDIPGVFIYSGKAHPHLAGADLIATYCTNASEFAEQIRNDALYYPRFVRLNRRR